MRWLMICFLVSLGALLIAAGAIARHVWLHHLLLHRGPAEVPQPVEESERELKS